MPSSIKLLAITVAVVLGRAAIVLGMAAIAGVGMAGLQEPVKAPQLPSTRTKSFLPDPDFQLNDYQQLRRFFFEESRDRLR